MTAPGPLPPDWLAQLARRLDQPPERPRMPLRWRRAAIGSVEPEFLAALRASQPDAGALLRETAGGVDVAGDDLTVSLAAIAAAMGDAGLAHAWRNEQLAVLDDAGTVLGSIERAVVRPLGIATHAVHLAGLAPDGRHWVQQRAFDKANDPGLWDTLMGGMVPAGDSLQQALARETWEEAGLRVGQLQDLRPGGVLVRRSPTPDVVGGYVVERIDWYRCVVPEGVEPRNQDGEVEKFELLEAAEVRRRLLAGEFTLEASGILAAL